MEIVYETNGNGFLGWLVEYPGAYVRGRTEAEARAKVQDELASYSAWLGIPEIQASLERETRVSSSAAVEDADSDILLDWDARDYASPVDFEKDCGLILVSAKKVNDLFLACDRKDVVDPVMVRDTFYGKVYSTIRRQYEHIVNVQLYYLRNVGTEADIGLDIIRGRHRMIEALEAQYAKNGNAILTNGAEAWTIRKAIRRSIWHDRIHGKAIERMKARLS